MYEMTFSHHLRAFGAALTLGTAIGFLWAILLPYGARGLGFFAFFVALGLGYLMAEAVSRVANRKRGPWMQGAAVCGIVLTYFVKNLLVGLPLLPSNDLIGYIVVGFGSLVAISQLR